MGTISIFDILTRALGKSIVTTMIVALLLGIFIISGQGCSTTLKISDESVAHAETEFETLSAKTRQIIQNLEYSNKAADEFIEMVNSWKDKNGCPLLVNWNRKLTRARRNYEQSKVSKTKLANIEERIAEKICYKIRNEINYNERFFRLEDITKNKQAQCLGYSQIFYILGKSIDLSVVPINVVELQNPGRLPTGQAHVSCIVNLSGGKTIMLNLVPNGFISWPFVIDERYTKIGNYRQLKRQDNPLNIFRKIQLLDENGLTAYIYNNQGTYSASAGQFDQAISDYTKAIDLNPNLAEVYNNRGIAYRNTDQLEQAVSDYTKAIERKSNFARAYGNRALTYALLGKSEVARKDLLKAVKLSPALKTYAQTTSSRFNLNLNLD